MKPCPTLIRTTVQLMRRMETLKDEKEQLAHDLAQEEELVVNTLRMKLAEVTSLHPPPGRLVVASALPHHPLPAPATTTCYHPDLWLSSRCSTWALEPPSSLLHTHPSSLLPAEQPNRHSCYFACLPLPCHMFTPGCMRSLVRMCMFCVYLCPMRVCNIRSSGRSRTWRTNWRRSRSAW